MANRSRFFSYFKLRHHDIITSLLLKDVLANCLILADTLLSKYDFWLRGKIDGIGFCKLIQQYDVIMALNYIIMSIKLCFDVGNDKGISLYNFGGFILSGFEVIEGEGGKGPRGREGKHCKKNCQIGSVHCFLYGVSFEMILGKLQ